MEPRICSACREPISGEFLNAFNLNWHKDHLVCRVCRTSFTDGRFYEGPDGFAYCVKHGKEKFLLMCVNCNEIIDGPSISAYNKAYHPDHFVCYICKNKLGSSFYPSSDHQPLCEYDYYSSINFICGKCEKPIISGEYVTIIISDGKEKRFHLEHFSCNFCQKSLRGKYEVHKDKAYCISCHTKHYG